MHDFSGGLNYTLPPDLIEENECVTMQNIIINPQTGLASSRPTFHKLLDLQDIKSAHIGENSCVVAGNAVYSFVADNVAHIADIDVIQSIKPTFTEWDDGIIIMTGGENIYFLKDSEITTITPKTPENTNINASAAFVRHGRVVLYSENSSTLYYSNIGELAWNYEESLSSNAKFIEIGYKDSGNIASVAPLANDIIIFKSNGNIYRLVNEYPDWQLIEIARGVKCLKRSVLPIMNSCFFMTDNGLLSIDTVEKYGDLQISENISRKVDPILKRSVGVSAEMYNLPSIQSVFINTNPNGENFVLSLQKVAFSTWALPFTVYTMAEKDDMIYLVSNNAIYKSNQDGIENGNELISKVITKSYYSDEKTLLKETEISVQSTSTGSVSVEIGKLTYNVTPQVSQIAFSDNSIAYSNTNQLINNEWQFFTFKDVVSAKFIRAIIVMTRNTGAKILLKISKIGDH